MNPVILDVRERDEFEAEHIALSIHVPLSQFKTVAPGVLNHLRDRELVMMCRSGARAKLAAHEIRNLGFADQVTASVYEGGILEWKRAGRETVVRHKSQLPIMRQVQIVAGSGVFISTILGAWVNPHFLYISGFFGAGLTFAGITGFCGLANLLAVMPWNRKLEP